MVFYFTGTGNSLYVSKQLEENPISIPQIIRKQNLEFFADSIGIVTPIYTVMRRRLWLRSFCKRAFSIQSIFI